MSFLVWNWAGTKNKSVQFKKNDASKVMGVMKRTNWAENVYFHDVQRLNFIYTLLYCRVYILYTFRSSLRRLCVLRLLKRISFYTIYISILTTCKIKVSCLLNKALSWFKYTNQIHLIHNLESIINLLQKSFQRYESHISTVQL